MKNDRAGLIQASKLAARTGKPILILRIDRIGRRASKILSMLEDPRIKIIVCELGLSADAFQMGLFSLLAAKERELISRRTKEGLKAAKARGTVLGNPNWEPALDSANKAVKRKGELSALRLYRLASMALTAKPLKTTHVYSQNTIVTRKIDVVDWLNENNFPTPSGKGTWDKQRFYRMFNRGEQIDKDIAAGLRTDPEADD